MHRRGWPGGVALLGTGRHRAVGPLEPGLFTCPGRRPERAWHTRRRQRGGGPLRQLGLRRAGSPARRPARLPVGPRDGFTAGRQPTTTPPPHSVRRHRRWADGPGPHRQRRSAPHPQRGNPCRRRARVESPGCRSSSGTPRRLLPRERGPPRDAAHYAEFRSAATRRDARTAGTSPGSTHASRRPPTRRCPQWR